MTTQRLEFEDWECGPYVKPCLVVQERDDNTGEWKPLRRFLLSEVNDAGLAKPWYVDPEKWSGNG